MKKNKMLGFRSGVIMTAVLILAAIAYIFSGAFAIVAGNSKAKPDAIDKGPASINGITLELIRGQQIEDQFQVKVCYSLPDQRDWLLSISPTDTLLSIDNEDYAVSVARMVSRDKGPDGNYNIRCEALLFPVHHVALRTPFQITVTKIFVSESETIDCPEIQKKIEATQPGILIQCANEPHVSGFHVISWPSEMTQMAANELAHDIVNDAKTGPWVFYGVSE